MPIVLLLLWSVCLVRPQNRLAKQTGHRGKCFHLLSLAGGKRTQRSGHAFLTVERHKLLWQPAARQKKSLSSLTDEVLERYRSLIFRERGILESDTPRAKTTFFSFETVTATKENYQKLSDHKIIYHRPTFTGKKGGGISARQKSNNARNNTKKRSHRICTGKREREKLNANELFFCFGLQLFFVSSALLVIISR